MTRKELAEGADMLVKRCLDLVGSTGGARRSANLDRARRPQGARSAHGDKAAGGRPNLAARQPSGFPGAGAARAPAASTTRSMIAWPCSTDALRAVANDAVVGNSRVAARPRPAHRRIEDGGAHRGCLRRMLGARRCVRGEPDRARAPASPKSRPFPREFPASPGSGTGLISAPRCIEQTLRPKSPTSS